MPKRKRREPKKNVTEAERIKFKEMWLGGSTIRQIAFALGKAEVWVKAKRIGLGLPPRHGKFNTHLRRFTPEDDAIIRADWASFTPVSVTAEKLNRSPGVIRQRQYALDVPPRDGCMTKMAKKYGPSVLTYGENARQIELVLAARAKVEKREAARGEQKRIKATLKEVHEKIANGMDRRQAFIWGRGEGLTLQQIGTSFGLTRERIRQLVLDKSRPTKARTTHYLLTCTRCPRTFYARSKHAKYCEVCRPKVFSERSANYRAAHPNYMKEWTERKRSTGDES